MLRDDLGSRKSFEIAGVGRVIRPCKLAGKHASHRLPVYLLLVFQQLTASWISSFPRFLLPISTSPYFFSPVSTQLLSLPFLFYFPLFLFLRLRARIARPRSFASPFHSILVFPAGRLSDPAILTVGCRVRLAISQVCSSFFFSLDLRNPASRARKSCFETGHYADRRSFSFPACWLDPSKINRLVSSSNDRSKRGYWLERAAGSFTRGSSVGYLRSKRD